MTKTQFRISLFENANSLCEKLAGMAARSNGCAAFTLGQIKSVAEGNIIEYPTINKGYTASLENNRLTITETRGEETKTVLSIEQIDVVELATANEISAAEMIAE